MGEILLLGNFKDVMKVRPLFCTHDATMCIYFLKGLIEMTTEKEEKGSTVSKFR